MRYVRRIRKTLISLKLSSRCDNIENIFFAERFIRLIKCSKLPVSRLITSQIPFATFHENWCRRKTIKVKTDRYWWTSEFRNPIFYILSLFMPLRSENRLKTRDFALLVSFRLAGLQKAYDPWRNASAVPLSLNTIYSCTLKELLTLENRIMKDRIIVYRVARFKAWNWCFNYSFQDCTQEYTSNMYEWVLFLARKFDNKRKNNYATISIGQDAANSYKKGQNNLRRCVAHDTRSRFRRNFARVKNPKLLLVSVLILRIARRYLSV